MTIIMTFFGVIVFFISLFTAGFKPAMIRLLCFAGFGLALDIALALFGLFVLHTTL